MSSSSPGRAKVSFYGIYLYDLAQVRIWPYEKANDAITIEVLERLQAEFSECLIKLVWDGVSYHRTLLVKERAQSLNISLVPLPGYSPDFMPVEYLWNWLREEVTYHTCFGIQQDLIAQVEHFRKRGNLDALELSQRLWATTELDPDVEKIRVST
ncbi:MAG: transposase [Cyanobacteria bacterium P01_F01_bin.53]